MRKWLIVPALLAFMLLAGTSNTDAYPYPDTDGDGTNEFDEQRIGTDEFFVCNTDRMTTATGDTRPSRTWPIDLDNTTTQIPDTQMKITIADINTFLAPVRRLDTEKNVHPNYDERWNIDNGNLTTDKINNGDLTKLFSSPSGFPPFRDGSKALNGSTPSCEPWLSGQLRFYSKLTAPDYWWDTQYGGATGALPFMNSNYDGVHNFDCGSTCTRYGLYQAGPTYTYQDSTKMDINGVSNFAGTTEAMILRDATQTFKCYQYWFTPQRVGAGNVRYIADVTDVNFQNAMVADLVALVGTSTTDGVYLDVADPYLPVAASCQNGSGQEVTPEATPATWLAAWATIVERVQAEVGGPLVVNTQPAIHGDLYAIDQGTSDQDADRYYKAPDLVENEFGFALENAPKTASDWNYLAGVINSIHALGTGVINQDFDDACPNCNPPYPGHNTCGEMMTTTEEKYGLASHYLFSNHLDMYSTFSRDGRECSNNQDDTFAPVYNSNLGRSMGPMFDYELLKRRDFLGPPSNTAGYSVLVNNPGGGPVTLNLTGYTSLWGEPLGLTTFDEFEGEIVTPRITNTADLVVLDAGNTNTQTLTFTAQDCAVQEGLVEEGARELILFGTTIVNQGTGPLHIGNMQSLSQSNPEKVQFDSCHGHFHVTDFSAYRLWAPSQFTDWQALKAANPNTSSDDLLAAHPELTPVVGRKQGWCPVDLQKMQYDSVDGWIFDSGGNWSSQTYNGYCGTGNDPADLSGITTNFSDIYGESFAGQWVDVTDVTPGSYKLEIEVNPDRDWPEGHYLNNSSDVDVVVN